MSVSDSNHEQGFNGEADLWRDDPDVEDITQTLRTETVVVTYYGPRVEDDHRREFYAGHKLIVTWYSDEIVELSQDIYSFLIEFILSEQAKNMKVPWIVWGIKYDLQYVPK